MFSGEGEVLALGTHEVLQRGPELVVLGMVGEPGASGVDRVAYVVRG